MRRHLQDFDFLLEQLGQTVELLAHRVHLQHALRVGDLEAHAAGDQVGELAAVVDVDRHDGKLVGHLRLKLDQAAEELLHGAHERLHLQIVSSTLGDDFDAGTQVGLLLHVLANADALLALHQQAHGAVRRLEDAVDLRRCADGVNLVGRGLFDLLVTAGDERNDAVVGERALDKANAALLANRKRQPHHRIDDDAAQWQHRQVVRNECDSAGSTSVCAANSSDSKITSSSSGSPQSSSPVDM